MDWHCFYTILQQTIIITTFVIGMMMIIEYINVSTGGLISHRLERAPWIQILFGALMGIFPGCLGTYTIVSLYVHRVVAFPALITALIATTGDEAFFMLSLFPQKALIINGCIFVLAIIIGFILNIFIKNKYLGLNNSHEMEIHLEEDTHCHKHSSNLKNISFVRALLIAGCIGVLLLIFSGFIDGSHQLNTLMGGEIEHHDHEHEHGGEADWICYTLMVMFIVILGIVVKAKEHFLQEHLWEHVIKVHFPKIFLWTFFIILALTLLNHFIDIHALIDSNGFIVLLIAILLGIIPQSGPHLIFIVLFAQGSLPLGILLANSIVQDGHGALPLLAESRKSFFIAKGIKIVLGFIIGLVFLLV